MKILLVSRSRNKRNIVPFQYGPCAERYPETIFQSGGISFFCKFSYNILSLASDDSFRLAERKKNSCKKTGYAAKYDRLTPCMAVEISDTRLWWVSLPAVIVAVTLIVDKYTPPQFISERQGQP